MNKMLTVALSLLIILGVSYISLFVLNAPGILLLAVLIGANMLCRRSKRCYFKNMKQPLIIVWMLALVSFLGFAFEWFVEGWDVLFWAIPFTIFTLTGIVLMFVKTFKESKQN
jgi:hypothetical protein